MKRFNSLFILFLAVIFPVVLSAQQVSDLFNAERSAAVFIDCATPYMEAVKLLQTINDPANKDFKQKLEQMFDIAVKNFGGARAKARGRECQANMRVLLGAVEMYNMDNHVMMGKDLDIQKLVSDKYIKSTPLCPDGGKYSARGDLSVNGAIQCSLHGTVEEFIEQKEESGKSIDFESLVKKLLEFDTNGLFQPTGGLYLVFEPVNAGGFALLIEARSKPDLLLAFLKDSLQLKLPEVEAGTDGSKIINLQVSPIQGAKKIKMVLSSQGLYVDALMSAEKVQPASSNWKSFSQMAAKDGNSLVIEILPQPIIQGSPMFKSLSGSGSSSQSCSANMRVLQGAVEMYNMDASMDTKMGGMMRSLDIQKLVEKKYLRSVLKCPNGGSYGDTGDISANGSIKCSIHNTVDALKTDDIPADPNSLPEIARKIQILRLIVGQKSSILAAGINDEKTVNSLKELLQAQIPNLKHIAMQQISAMEQQAGDQISEFDRNSIKLLKDFVTSAEVFQKGTWCGIRSAGLPGNHMVIPIIGIAAAVALPNFHQARGEARSKACHANQKVIAAAMEMYAMDNPEPMKQLDMQTLVSGQYMRSEPKCPEGGTYSAEMTPEGFFNVKCSKHGSFE
ncbi:MAG: hypothetical protein AB1403_08120 [Candidatus Riflebacteria bacterium]